MHRSPGHPEVADPRTRKPRMFLLLVGLLLRKPRLSFLVVFVFLWVLTPMFTPSDGK